MTDFLAVPRTHSLIIRNREVIAQTATFLHTGRFQHAAPGRLSL